MGKPEVRELAESVLEREIMVWNDLRAEREHP